MADPQALEAFPTDWQRALAIAAHPDDLEYGMASAIARWTSEGREVAYVLVTSGEAGIDGMTPEECGPLREDEERAGAAVVGVSEVEFLGHRDGVVEYGLALRRDLASAIRRHRPEVILTANRHLHWAGGNGFNMADHRHVGLACLDAARDAANRWIFPDLLDEGAEPWNGARWVAFGGSPEATHGVDVTGHLAKGIESLEAHSAYLRGLGDGFPPPAELLTARAGAEGPRIGVEHAVAFELISL